MVGKLGDVVVERCRIEKLDRLTDLLVTLLATLAKDRGIGTLLGRRLLEDVLDVGDSRLLVDELAELQIADQPLKHFLRAPGDSPCQAQDELAAEHGKRLQQVLLIVAQPVDARGEDGLHRRRYAQRGEGSYELHRSVGPLESTLVEQRLHSFFHEERRSTGGLDDELFQQQEIRRFTQERREHSLCRPWGQSAQPHLLAVALASPT